MIGSIRYTLVRAQRKTIALCIRPDGTLEVRAPRYADTAHIERFIIEKHNWIVEKSEQVKKRSKEMAVDFSDGGKILFKGNLYTIAVKKGISRTKIVDSIMLCPDLGDKHIKKSIVAFFRKEARRLIEERIVFLSAKFSFAYAKVRITSAKTRWGSCSSRGTLSFSYRLIAAPPAVIDSVILHELCHTRVMNHSKAFYSLLKSCDPVYKDHDSWLKKNKGLMFAL